MPLKCLSRDSELFSFDFDKPDWQALREQNKRFKNLGMPCCGSAVVLKESKLTTKFFAHARKGECTTQPETAEHLLAKAEIARAVATAGWEVTTEKTGSTITGENWQADVFAYRGEKAKVAIEVQWSDQSDDETARRQERYRQSGVRGLWLFRQKNFHTSEAIPAFRLVFCAASRTFSVSVPAGQYAVQTIELRRFIRGALLGALKFAPAVGHEIPVEAYGDDTDCWRCKRSSRQITHFNIAASRLFQGYDDWEFDLNDLQESPTGKEVIAQILPERSVLNRCGFWPNQDTLQQNYSAELYF